MPRNRGKRETLAPGIYRDDRGISIVATVGGQQEERRYPLDTPLEELQRHRRTLAAAMRKTRRAATPGTLAGDADAYLRAVRSMPSYATRATYVDHWVTALGDVKRRALTPVQIRQQLQAWATGPQPRYGTPYAPETLRHLLKVLRHWYTVLDGKGARNPARDVPLPAAPKPEPRAIPPLAVAHILRQFRARSQTRARLAVIATTAMTHAELKRLQPAHIQWEAGVVIALARRKGAGAEARSIPMTRHARLALRAFARVKAWGDFSNSSMHARFRAACEAAGYGETDWRPYDLRHTMLTEVARLTRDDRAVQEWAGHTSAAMVRRYTLGSVSTRLAQAAGAFAKPKTPKP